LSRPANSPPDPDLDPAAARASLRRRSLWCLGIVIALVALDLWSKQAAFSLLADPDTTLVRDPHNGHDRFPLVGEWLAFMHNLNYGAAFGQLTGIPHLLVGLRVLAVVLLSVLIVRTPLGSGVYLTSLVLIVAGAAGNLYDNFFYSPPGGSGDRPYGPVRDFIDVYFGIWEWHFPTFNVADSCITVGAGLLLLSGFGSSAAAQGATADGEASGEADGEASGKGEREGATEGESIPETGGASAAGSREESGTPGERVAPTPGLD